jgi:hypothetical protein
MNMSNRPERLFILIVGSLWVSLICIDRLAPVVLPTQTLYFRAWEYVRGQHGYPRKDQTFTVRNAHGDLSNMLNVSAYKVRRDIRFTVDGKGMRNLSTPPKGSTILVGQSFIAGAGNTDSLTLGAELQRNLELPIVVYAPANMSKLLTNIPAMEKPKLVLWGVVERNLTDSNAEIQTLLHMNCPEEISKKTPKDYLFLFAKTLLLEPTTYVRSSLTQKVGQRIYSEIYFSLLSRPASPHITMAEDPSSFIFLKKSVRIAKEDFETRGMGHVQQAIENVQSCLSSQGITLVFIPIPDKVHIYNTLLPKELQADYATDPLKELVYNTQSTGTHTVDVITPYIQHASLHDELLYWPDDTHWNPKGISLAATTITEYLMKHIELPHREVPKENEDL